MQNVVIFGASGHGSVVLDCIEKEAKFKVVGFIDSFKSIGAEVNGYTVLGNEYDLPELIEKYKIFGGIVAIGDNWTRSLVVDRILKIESQFNFISAIHPNAQIGKDVQIGNGSVIMPGVTVNANAIIARHCILNTNSSLDHDGFMNKFSSLAPNVCVGGNFILGRGSAICLGTNIIENITVGEYSVIGSGSLLVGNVSDCLLVYGAPAKIIRKRIPSEPYLSGNSSSTTTFPLLSKEI